MSISFHIVVCGGIVPDPLQTLEPVSGPNGPALRNELVLPHVLDPWAGHALYEAAHLAKKCPGSKVWLVSLAPKAKLQQVMMTVAQRVPLELVAIDGPSPVDSPMRPMSQRRSPEPSRTSPGSTARGCCCSAAGNRLRAAPAQPCRLSASGWASLDQFQGVDELTVADDGSLRILERVEGGQHQVSVCDGPPALLGWATGNLPEPSNSPQVGMQNMRLIMPALQKARASGDRARRHVRERRRCRSSSATRAS